MMHAGDPDFLTSMYSIRMMRHVYRFRRMSEAQWRRAQWVLGSLANHYLLTKLPMVEARLPRGDQLMDPELRHLAPGGAERATLNLPP